jgi:uncharacterized membrane protein YkvA (DUF1232 family)
MNEEIITKEENEKQLSGFVRTISEPLSKHGWPSWLVYVLAILGVLYLLNPTFGVLEFIPDNLPIIGNMDEGVATMLILAGIVELIEGKKFRKTVNKEKVEKQSKENSKKKSSS